MRPVERLGKAATTMGSEFELRSPLLRAEAGLKFWICDFGLRKKGKRVSRPTAAAYVHQVCPTAQRRLAFCCVCGDKVFVSYTGKVQNGVVVLSPEVKLPEGTEVKVTIPDSAHNGSFADRYARYIGAADDLPSDLAANIDHYVHGQHKK